MIRVTVYDLNSKVIAEEDFASSLEALEWAEERSLSGAFGRRERWVDSQDLVAKNEDRAKATEAKFFGENTSLFFPAEFRIETREAPLETQYEFQELTGRHAVDVE